MKRKLYDDPPKKCKECGKLLGLHNKSMLCQFHFKKEYNKRPDVKKRIKEYQQRPEYKAKKKEYLKKYYQKHKKIKNEKKNL